MMSAVPIGCVGWFTSSQRWLVSCERTRGIRRSKERLMRLVICGRRTLSPEMVPSPRLVQNSISWMRPFLLVVSEKGIGRLRETLGRTKRGCPTKPPPEGKLPLGGLNVHDEVEVLKPCLHADVTVHDDLLAGEAGNALLFLLPFNRKCDGKLALDAAQAMIRRVLA
jgi:hypothetical protein